jgi:hypothetical protein
VKLDDLDALADQLENEASWTAPYDPAPYFELRAVETRQDAQALREQTVYPKEWRRYE